MDKDSLQTQKQMNEEMKIKYSEIQEKVKEENAKKINAKIDNANNENAEIENANKSQEYEIPDDEIIPL